MKASLIYFCIIFGCLQLSTSYAWDNDDLEIFDLVEEIDKNFYEVLGIQQVKQTLSVCRVQNGRLSTFDYIKC